MPLKNITHVHVYKNGDNVRFTCTGWMVDGDVNTAFDSRHCDLQSTRPPDIAIKQFRCALNRTEMSRMRDFFRSYSWKLDGFGFVLKLTLLPGCW